MTRGAWGLLILFVSAGAIAGERLDDSASPRARVPAVSALTDEGRPLADSRNPTRVQLRFGRIDYRLATARHVGRAARIFYVVPPLIAGLRSPAGMRVEWRGLGAFQSGTARPGERQQVWAGTVPGPWMNESIELTVDLDLRELQLGRDGQFGFEGYFEIEVQP